MNKIYTVSTVNAAVKAKLSADLSLQGIAVKGELLNCSVNSASGHFYFTMTDSRASVRGVMYASNAQKLKFYPCDGMSVIAYGGMGLYERDGTYQIIASQMIPDGKGSEYLAFQKLREKLSALGVFSAPKKPLPRYPKRIAVVTSPTGAAIEDVKKVISQRYPIVEISIFPTAVQGVDAPLGISSALSQADMSGADVIILTRGGGSAEDLSAFNTEPVVMAVYNCRTPVISAVGHEIDLTLCDFAADMRAPTPSGAALLATPDIGQMKSEISALRLMINSAAREKINRAREDISRYRFALSALSVEEKIKLRRAEVAALSEKLSGAVGNRLGAAKMTLERLRELLISLNPENVLSRGYAMIYKGENVAGSADALCEGDQIKIVMKGGKADATVNKVKSGDNGEL